MTKTEKMFSVCGYDVYRVSRKPTIAPCSSDGKVVETDHDTKEGVCRCPLNNKGFLVDSNNRVLPVDDYVIVSCS